MDLCEMGSVFLKKNGGEMKKRGRRRLGVVRGKKIN